MDFEDHEESGTSSVAGLLVLVGLSVVAILPGGLHPFLALLLPLQSTFIFVAEVWRKNPSNLSADLLNGHLVGVECGSDSKHMRTGRRLLLDGGTFEQFVQSLS